MVEEKELFLRVGDKEWSGKQARMMINIGTWMVTSFIFMAGFWVGRLWK